jgi:hypothetical protein
MKATKQAPPAGRTSEEPEVGSEHDDRVEDPECFVEMLDRNNARVTNASSPARLDSKWRVVDRDHLLPPFLKVQRHPTTSASDIEDASAGKPHRSSLMRRPAPKRGEVVSGRATAPGKEAVIALDDLHVRLAALEGV